jgi:hypothetical protein
MTFQTLVPQKESQYEIWNRRLLVKQKGLVEEKENKNRVSSLEMININVAVQDNKIISAINLVR